MKPPFPSLTPTWHNDTYSAISPTRPELSMKGKTVVIVGAASVIGRETGVAFAQAGADRVALLGRDEAELEATRSLLPAASGSSTHLADIANEEQLRQAAAEIGQWHILIVAAGYTSRKEPMLSSNADDWWKTFEVNTKGTFLTVRAFMKTSGQDATVLGITTGTSSLPASHLSGLSAYVSSKLAQTKIIEFLAAENEAIFAATIHPGMVSSALFKKAGGREDQLPMDTVKLPAHFTVWMASPEARFLNGRSVWVNWDVEELKAQSGSIAPTLDLIAGIQGWPFEKKA